MTACGCRTWQFLKLTMHKKTRATFGKEFLKIDLAGSLVCNWHRECMKASCKGWFLQTTNQQQFQLCQKWIFWHLKRSICEELWKQCVVNFVVVICVFQPCSTAEASKSSAASSAGISRNWLSGDSRNRKLKFSLVILVMTMTSKGTSEGKVRGWCQTLAALVCSNDAIAQLARRHLIASFIHALHNMLRQLAVRSCCIGCCVAWNKHIRLFRIAWAGKPMSNSRHKVAAVLGFFGILIDWTRFDGSDFCTWETCTMMRMLTMHAIDNGTPWHSQDCRRPLFCKIRGRNPWSSARRATGNRPDAMGMTMLNGRLGANCPFKIGNCPFTMAKAVSHVHWGPFEWPNISNKCVLFAAWIVCKLEMLNEHLVHWLNLVALLPRRS